MGKRNRVKSKKRKSHISNFAIMARLIPGPREIIESKEKIIDQLKCIYSKYLKELQNSIQLRKRGMIPKHPKINPNLEEYNYYEYHNHDLCDEFNHIFSMQVNKFINSVLLYLREVYLAQPSIMKHCVQDSRIILEIACKEAQKLTFFLYQTNEKSYQDISRMLFQEIIMKDKLTQKYFQENALQEKTQIVESIVRIKDSDNSESAIVSNEKKKKKKKKKEVIDVVNELDKEIEEFKSKLEIENIPCYKHKPNLSDDWIAGLRKRLKKRL